MYKKFLLVSFVFFFFYLVFVFLSPTSVSAFYPIECGSGSYARGDCRGITTPPPDCGPNGQYCCDTVASLIDPSGATTGTCYDYCSANIGPVIYGVCPVDQTAFKALTNHFFCCTYTTPTPTPTLPPPPTPTPTPFNCSFLQGGIIYSCSSGGCPADWVSASQNPNTTCAQFGETCCWYNPPPTPTLCPGCLPTPTPTPGPLYMIYGTVYYDNSIPPNGAYDPGVDTLYPGTSSLSDGTPYAAITNGPPTGTYSINSTGYYGTSRIYVPNTLYTVTLQNIPTGCSVYNNANSNSFSMPPSDRTINYPLICGGPTPTPISCESLGYSCGFSLPNTNCQWLSYTCIAPGFCYTCPPPTPTPTPTPPPCPPGTIYSITGTVTGQPSGTKLTVCRDPNTPGSCINAAASAKTNPANGSYTLSNISSDTYHLIYLDPTSLPVNYSVSSTNPVNISSNTCPSKINFTISTAAAPTPTPTPPLAGPTATPAPPTPTSGPPPPSCNYIDPPANSPTVTLEQNGHTLDITYSLSGVTNPSINFYRNTTPGFYATSPSTVTLFSTQFGNQGLTFHTNPQYPAQIGSGYATYYNYQIVKTSSEGTSYSNSSSVAVRKPNLPPCNVSGQYGYTPGTISDTSQVSSTDTSFTFDLSYYVNSWTNFGCSGGTCYPSGLPPYLKIQRASSNTSTYIPFNSYTGSLTSSCTSYGWFNGCTTTTWKARYTLSLPPATSDALTVSGYRGDICSADLNGSANFTASTQEGQAVALGTNPTLTAAQTLVDTGEGLSDGSSVTLNWTPSQDAVDVQAYYTQGATSRWTPGTPLTSTTPVWNGSAWVSTATDDLRTLPTGTYYYGAQVNYAFSCGPVQTDQTAFNWAGQFYTISGNVFVDTNKNRLKDPGEQNYKGPITIASAGSIAYQGNGNFKVSDLPEGTYTISYTSLPTGYQVSYPVNGPPPSFDITVGTACSVGSSNSATCIGQGDIKDLNFGITNLIPWIQSVGLDLRIDSGFNSYIPASALQPYASTLGSGGTPGIIFSGDNSYDFGLGQASPSPFNWIVGGFTYPEIFVPKQLGVIQTSYAYQIATADKNGLTPTDIAAYCTGGIGSCILSSALPHGLYISNGNLTIDNLSYAFGSDQDFVILVNGDLTLNGNITVPNGSTVTFSVSGNINVDKSVTNIQGYYSTDQNFTVQGINNCTVGSDVQLKVEGSVVVNAGLAGGTFQNQRDLCANNTTTPSVQFIERPDFIINSPQLIHFGNPIWKEVAP